MLLTTLYSVRGSGVRANSQTRSDGETASSETLVIQGRITGIQGTLVTLKVPSGYPGETGGHAQFVTAGPIFKVDVSHARVLLPDGKRMDKVPLAIGDELLMVLTANSGPPEPNSVSPAYSASIVERLVRGDKIITH